VCHHASLDNFGISSVPAAGKALDGISAAIRCTVPVATPSSTAIFRLPMTGMDGTRRRPYIGLRRWPICNGHVKSPEKLLAINSLGGG
jgi:hypothetical protein